MVFLTKKRNTYIDTHLNKTVWSNLYLIAILDLDKQRDRNVVLPNKENVKSPFHQAP